MATVGRRSLALFSLDDKSAYEEVLARDDAKKRGELSLKHGEPREVCFPLNPWRFSGTWGQAGGGHRVPREKKYNKGLGGHRGGWLRGKRKGVSSIRRIPSPLRCIKGSFVELRFRYVYIKRIPLHLLCSKIEEQEREHAN